MSKYNLVDIYEQYKIGSGWTKDFDYDGMLTTALGTSIDTPIEVLKRISDDFEDVNYHRENHHLQDAIDAIEIGDMVEAEGRLNNFHAEIRKTQEEQGMDIEPTVGQFMASKMEESKKEVEEVTSREGSRIEGLLDINMKEQFLDAFEDLYFNLVEEDPFAAEDVVDHLANEMMKHLDAIQAQGDKLNKAGNPSIEFTPGERIGESLDDLNDDEYDDGPDGKFVGELDNTLNVDKVASPDAKAHDYGAEIKGISDEDDTEEKYAHGMVLPLEEMFGPVKFLKSKGIDDDIIADFMKVHAKDIVGASEDEIMDEFENFRSVNYDYIDEDLRSHFKRFI